VTPAAGDDFITVPENLEDGRAFLQVRIALFGRLLAVMTTLFLIGSASSYFLLTPDPSLTLRLSLDKYDLLAIALFLGLWALTRRGRLPLGLLRGLEAGVSILTCAGYALMVQGSTQELNLLVPVLAAMAVLMTRAMIIPTTPRRTFAISLVACVPFVVSAYFLARDIGAETSIPSILGPTVYVGCWLGMITALATLASRIVFGLEQKVRAARKLGQYTLVARIGQGGMGVVYRAEHAMLRRPTAIKVLPPEKMGDENVRRFEREVQLTSQLTHPNTICIYDYGRTPDGLFYYAMEYLDGFTLTELVELAGPLPPARVAFLMRQAAGSLDEAHGIGLIHRDVKPDNIVVCARGGAADVVKVLDFGLVKAHHSPDPALSQADALVGTPLTMSPEAFLEPGSVGAASDIYALGAVAYYLATGRHVFQATSLFALSAMHVGEPPEPPSQARGEPLPEAMERLILECLAKKPADRPPSARELERRWAALIDGGWSSDDALGWWQKHQADLATRRGPRSATPDRQTLVPFEATVPVER